MKRVFVADTGPLIALAEQPTTQPPPTGPIACLMDCPTRVRLRCESRVGAWGSACYAMKGTGSTVSRGSRDAEDRFARAISIRLLRSSYLRRANWTVTNATPYTKAERTAHSSTRTDGMAIQSAGLKFPNPCVESG